MWVKQNEYGYIDRVRSKYHAQAKNSTQKRKKLCAATTTMEDARMKQMNAGLRTQNFAECSNNMDQKESIKSMILIKPTV